MIHDLYKNHIQSLKDLRGYCRYVLNVLYITTKTTCIYGERIFAIVLYLDINFIPFLTAFLHSTMLDFIYVKYIVHYE